MEINILHFHKIFYQTLKIKFFILNKCIKIAEIVKQIMFYKILMFYWVIVLIYRDLKRKV
mgnify:CR=1 FL=1